MCEKFIAEEAKAAREEAEQRMRELMDDAIRFAMMLEESEHPPIHVLEVEDQVMLKTCQMHNYNYTVITSADVVIPPETSNDFI